MERSRVLEMIEKCDSAYTPCEEVNGFLVNLLREIDEKEKTPGKQILYAVTRETACDFEIKMITTSKERAERIQKMLFDGFADVEIKEYIDGAIDFDESKFRFYWYIKLDEKGKMIFSQERSYELPTGQFTDLEFPKFEWVFATRNSKFPQFIAKIKADTLKEAEKITQDMRIKLISEQLGISIMEARS